MPDFLLELLSEEIPARMQAKAQADLARLFTEQLAAAGQAAVDCIHAQSHAFTPLRAARLLERADFGTQGGDPFGFLCHTRLDSFVRLMFRACSGRVKAVESLCGPRLRSSRA